MDRTLNVSEYDLLAELEAMLSPEGEGLRTIEIAKILNLSESSVRGLLHLLSEQGKLDRVRKRFVGLDGRAQTRIAWRLKRVEKEL